MQYLYIFVQHPTKVIQGILCIVLNTPILFVSHQIWTNYLTWPTFSIIWTIAISYFSRYNNSLSKQFKLVRTNLFCNANNIFCIWKVLNVSNTWITEFMETNRRSYWEQRNICFKSKNYSSSIMQHIENVYVRCTYFYLKNIFVFDDLIM